MPTPFSEKEIRDYDKTYTVTIDIEVPDTQGEKISFQVPWPTDRNTFIIRGHEKAFVPLIRHEETKFLENYLKIVISKALRNIMVSVELNQPQDIDATVRWLRKYIYHLTRACESLFLPWWTHPNESVLSQPLDETNVLSDIMYIRKRTKVEPKKDPWEYEEDARIVGDEGVCPIVTPQSERVGLTLFRKIGKSETGSLSSLSPAPLLIPFMEYNNPTRLTLSSIMMCQAVPLKEPEFPLVKTGFEKKVAVESKRCFFAEDDGKVQSIDRQSITLKYKKSGEKKVPILKNLTNNISKVRLGQISRVKKGKSFKKGEIILDYSTTQDGEVVLGKNAIVGFLPWFGYNFEDGIVVSEKFAQNFTSLHTKEFKERIPRLTNYYIEMKKVNEEDEVKKGDILLEYRQVQGNGKKIRCWDLDVKGRVSEVIEYFDENHNEKVIKIKVNYERTLQVGDKLANRHGNKGIVTCILPQNEMPYFKENEGEVYLEVLLNPFGVVSRANCGQLYEASWGRIAHKQRKPLIFQPLSSPTKENLQEALKKIELPEDGKEILYFQRNRKEIKIGRVTVGHLYILKLNHFADETIHYRAKGDPKRDYLTATGQPTKGKKKQGGQRIGEMETWALEAYNAWKTLETLFTLRAEPSAPLKAFRMLLFLLRSIFLNPKLHDGDGKNITNQLLEKLDSESTLSYASINMAGDKEVEKWSRGTVTNSTLKDAELRQESALFSKKIFKNRDRAMGHIELGVELPNPILDNEIELIFEDEVVSSLKEKVKKIKEIDGDWIDRKISETEEQLQNYENAIAESKESKESEERKKFRKRVKILRYKKLTLGWIRNEDVRNRLVINKIPIIPPDFRPLFIPEGGESIVRKNPTDLNTWYAKIIEITNYVKKRRPPEMILRDKQNQLDYLIRGLRDCILKKIPGREGVFREYLLGKRVDFSGWGVIVPDPDLNIDECKLPNEMKTKDSVLLVRFPTLHRMNLQSFQPSHHNEKVIAISPLVTKGFNADFDGDCMAVYNTNPSLKEEVRTLSPISNLFSPANGDLTITLTKDILYGLKKMIENGRLKKVLKGSNSISDVQKVKEHLEKLLLAGTIGKKTLKKLVKESFKEATLSGVTLSVFDGDNPIFEVYAPNKVEKYTQFLKGINDIKKFFEKVVQARRDQIDEKLGVAKAGFFTRQLVEASQKTRIIENDCQTLEGIIVSDKEWLFGRTLAETIEAGNMRLEAGEVITRELSEKLQGKKIKIRSPLTCNSKGGICQKCYGWDLSKLNFPAIGTPIGIIAAQSIGERGTQLSLWKKGGGESVSIKDARKLFSRKSNNVQVVIKKIKKFKIYGQDINQKHFEVVFKSLKKENEFISLNRAIKEEPWLRAISFIEKPYLIRARLAKAVGERELASLETIKDFVMIEDFSKL